MNETRRLKLNITTSLFLKIITLLSGLILPKIMIGKYGSEMNGLITSITRFLNIINFLDLGVCAVVESSLYKPLADRDNTLLSKILVSAKKFYKKIAYILITYIFLLVLLFPKIDSSVDYITTTSLILIISISMFSQYYIGISYQIFIGADQKYYITNILQIFTVIVNTIFTIIFVAKGYSIFTVKFVSSIVYIIRPILTYLYVKKNYNLNLKIKYDKNPIEQRWNGLAQHLAYTVNAQIDIILLTLVSNYTIVSIYSVYSMIVNGVSTLILSFFNGISPYWGNMIAKKEMKKIEKSFSKSELLFHILTTIVYSAMAVLISPFALVYTKGNYDSLIYYLPLFGILITIATFCESLRSFYFLIINSAGHYRQTQKGSFVAMIINIIVSSILVVNFNLNGVVVGTICSMLYYTLYLVHYLKNNVLNRPIKFFYFHFVIDITSFVIVYIVSRIWTMAKITAWSWIVYAFKVTILSILVVLIINFLFYGKQLLSIFKSFFMRKGD